MTQAIANLKEIANRKCGLLKFKWEDENYFHIQQLVSIPQGEDHFITILYSRPNHPRMQQ